MLTGKRPLLNLGHRGFSSLYPENTLTSFEQALAAGADGFECDLRMTADGEIVVFHDETLERLCGISGSVEESSWDELKILKILSKEKFCRLEDILNHFPSARINLEIKVSKFSDRLVLKTLEILRTTPLKNRILISSFSWEILQFAATHLKNSQDRIDLGFIFYKPDQESLDNIRKASWLYSLHPHYEALSELPSDLAHPLWIWTPNNPDQWTTCLSYPFRIAAFISDYPDRLHDFLRSSSTQKT